MVLAAAWLFVLCTPAWAHARLLESSPGEGETLPSPPERVELRFSEEVDASFDPVEVFDGAGGRVDRQNTTVDPDDPEVLLAPLRDLEKGTYTVNYRVTSLDGHVVDGTYEFTVRSAKDDQSSQPSAESAQAQSSEDSGEPAEAGSTGFALISGGNAVSLGVAVALLLGLAGLALTHRNRGGRG